MAEIFLNPNLPNYFKECLDIVDENSARSLIDDYEDAKAITFPGLKLDIDMKFWADLDVDGNPGLKKFRAAVDDAAFDDVSQHWRSLIVHGVEEALADRLCENFRSIYAAVLPIYRKIFADYEFDRQKVVWRLNTILNENMHVDTYKEENYNHFARMFINLDDRPRIWQTSWTINEIMDLARNAIPAEKLQAMTLGQTWAAMNTSVFGATSLEWWDTQPRHVSYFQPGEAWIVDSRQIAHQIFYGRRALSIDFSLPQSSMKNPERHYLRFAERFRSTALQKIAA